jgi:flagellar motor switch protein FliN/FliY
MDPTNQPLTSPDQPEDSPDVAMAEPALATSAIPEFASAASGPPPHTPPAEPAPGLNRQLLKIPVNVQVILGSTRLPLSQVMGLAPGSIIALDKELSEPVSLEVNGSEVARGMIVVVDEKTGQLGISLTHISSTQSPHAAELV